MNKPRNHILLTLTILLLSARGWTRETGPFLKAPPSQPNILLVTIDTLRADYLSCYNSSKVHTPNIDRLAKRSVLFKRTFAHTPMTLPSHASILLGTTPVFHGVHDNSNFSVHPSHLTMAEYLKSNGYRTAAFVSATPLDSRFGLGQGFDVYNDDFMPPGAAKIAKAEQRAEAAVQKALDWYKTGGDEPWFLWIHVYDPHIDYDPPEPFRTRYPDDPYAGEVAYVDHALGRVFKTLEDDRTAEKTLIVLTSDHGESLGDHGEDTHGVFAYNSVLWVPLLIAVPGNKGASTNALSVHADLWPTVCDLAGVDIPPGLQGISLRPAMEGKNLPPRRIYFESMAFYYTQGWAPIRGYLDGEKKFIDTPVYEVYDIIKDFDEKTNLAPKVEIDFYRSHLSQLVKQLSPLNAVSAKTRISPELKKQLESLGYMASTAAGRKTTFGPEDDSKNLLPLFNRTMNAYSLKNQGKRSEAIRLLEKIVAEPKKIMTTYVRLAELLGEAGDQKKAIEVLQEGHRYFPSNYEILANLAEILLAANRPAEVVDLTGNAQYMLKMDQDATIWNFQGQAFLKLKETEKAIESFERSISVDDEYVDGLYGLASAYLLLSTETEDPSFCAEAIPLLERVIELNPRHAGAHSSLGSAFMTTGALDAAVPMFEQALKLRPELVRANFNLGMIHFLKTEFQKAVNYFETYKKSAYAKLSPEEKKNLDLFIKKSREGIR